MVKRKHTALIDTFKLERGKPHWRIPDPSDLYDKVEDVFKLDKEHSGEYDPLRNYIDLIGDVTERAKPWIKNQTTKVSFKKIPRTASISTGLTTKELINHLEKRLSESLSILSKNDVEILLQETITNEINPWTKESYNSGSSYLFIDRFRRDIIMLSNWIRHCKSLKESRISRSFELDYVIEPIAKFWSNTLGRSFSAKVAESGVPQSADAVFIFCVLVLAKVEITYFKPHLNESMKRVKRKLKL